MREYLQMTLRIWKMLTLFIVLMAAFYFGLAWVDRQQANFHRYDEPGGGAVRVSLQQPAAGRGNFENRTWDFWARIFEFLRDGE